MPHYETGPSKPRTRKVVVRAAGLVALLAACLLPASAVAAPQLEVELTRDVDVLDPVHRSDQRVDYDVTVSNAAPVANPQVGETMTCEDGAWNGGPDFDYQWLRNGAPIGSAESKEYELQADDEGEVIQCRVIGENADGTAVSASLPTLVVGSDPTDGHPSALQASASWPRITPSRDVTYNETAEEFETTEGSSPFLSCEAPGNWTGPGLTWSFRWLRNGVDLGTDNVVDPPPTPTTSEYELQLDDRFTVIQCEAIVEDENGLKAVATSLSKRMEVPDSPGPRVDGLVEAVFPGDSVDDTVGPVTVEVELPGGLETFVERFYDAGDNDQEATTNPVGWSCATEAATPAQPATATCERSDPLGAGAAYPTFAVAAALGADAPDTAVATATVSNSGVPDASAVDEFELLPAKVFGVDVFRTAVLDELGAPYRQAGGHPLSAGAEFSFNLFRLRTPSGGDVTAAFSRIEPTRTVRTETPRGFVGNPLAIEELCPSAEHVVLASCSPESAVGGLTLDFAEGGATGIVDLLIYAIEPEFGRPAQFGFTESFTEGLYTFYPKLRPEDGYAITLESAPLPSSFPRISGADAVVCGFGAKTRVGGTIFDGCKEGTDPSANLKPLVTAPTRCDAGPPTTRLAIDSWQNPGKFVSKSFSDPTLIDCDKVDFEPEMSLDPTSDDADSPTGMDVEIFMPTDGLESKTGISQANLKRVAVKFPEGMSVNATAGHGLGACTSSQFGMSSNTGTPNDAEARCPDSSKIGTIGITTPLLQEKLTGDVFIAKQGDDNPFDSNIALYMSFSSPKDGIRIKVAGEVKPDPETGQMEVVFDDNPEAPFSSVELNFPQGPRSPLLNPPSCGTHEIEAELSPWTGGAPVTTTSTFQVTEGPGGGPCPSGDLDPSLSTGVTNPLAGQTSDFVMRLSREDGSERFKALTLTPPLGLTAYLRGVPYCPDAVLAAISGDPESGQGEIDSPSCPAASQIGTASAGAGAGSNPLYVETGKAYLAGPYKGAPLSIAVVTPAVAGPLDLGNVVIRNAVYVNPTNAQIRVVSDEIPRILHGILLNIRDIRVQVNRPNFTNNPTSCTEKRVGVDVAGDEGSIAQLANRFQVVGCANLGFEPRTKVQLYGGIRRGAYQGVKAVVRPRPGHANIDRAVVRFPRSAFVAQEHLKNICTRVQFAADACPKGSIYGKAVAWSPLLDYPLEGNVHLRSSNNTLPDLVADMRGPAHQPIKVEVAIRNDSVKGALRNTVQTAPDAPVSFFRLQTFGKDKGLIVNSRNICAGRNDATVIMNGHNGKRDVQRTRVFNRRCAKLAKKRRAQRRQARRSARQGKAPSRVARLNRARGLR